MKHFFPVVLLLFLISSLNAQVIHDPNDPIYKDIDQWAIRGFITEPLPFIRPYPAPLIDSLLSEVARGGNLEAREKAAAYQAAMAPGSPLIHPGLTGSVEGRDDDLAVEGAPAIDGLIRLRDWISGSYSFFVYGLTKTPGNELNVPLAYSPYPDLVPDWAAMGPLKIMPDWTSIIAFGKSGFYFQAGLGRSSFGPFYDNGTIIGPQAGRAGHFSLNYRQPSWSFEMLLLSLTASNDFGEGDFPEKYLVLHSINFNPCSNLEFGFVETVVWGGRFEFLYLPPFIQLFAAQSMSDFGDNSFIGFHLRWNPIRNTQVLTQLYVDDLHFNNLVRFKFNTKYKLAGELGLRWAPPEGFLASLSADYTLVFPYMYTHWNTVEADRYNPDKPNYVVYSHKGRSLGTDLEPNSDRIVIKSLWRTLPNLNLSLLAYFTRHGNPSLDADMEPGERHDGSIFDDGVPADGTNNYSTLHFLTQSILDIRLAGGLGLSWFLPVSWGTVSLDADYVLEYGWNRDIIKNNNGLTHYWSVGLSWRF
ncbi:MAG: capsule assembly Wzi family protein [Treponema sp.]|jgi:hypothetical protein|nr:capsule assembly Wzi family protein [Treponema sp.]